MQRADSIMHEQYTTLEYKEADIRLKNILLEREAENRETAEQSQRQSESKLRSVFESSGLGILIHRDRKPLLANQALADMYGFDSIEHIMALETTAVMIAPEYFEEDYHQTRLEGTPKNREIIGIKVDGSRFWVHINSFRIELEDGPAVCSCRIDITDRKNAEDAAQKSETRFRDAIESLQEGFAMFDAEDKLLAYNNEYVRAHEEIKDIIAPGVPFETLVRAHVFQGVFAEAIGNEEEFIRMRLLLRRQNRFGSAVRKLENGLSFIIRENRMADGGLFVTYTDITQIQQANQRFRQGEARFRSFVKNLPVAISIKGNDGQYQIVNKAFEDWYDVSNDDVMGKTPEQVFAGQTGLLKDVSAHNQSIMDGAPPSSREAILTIPGRDKRIVDLTKFSIRDDDGEMIGIGTIGSDITERKTAEEESRRSEDRFRTLIEKSTMGIFVHRNYKPLMANPAITEMYGFDSVDDFLKIESIQNLTNPEYRSHLHARGLFTQDTQTNNEHLGVKADGTEFWVRKRTFSIDWDGEPATCSIREDITQAKESETALQESEGRFRGAIENLQEAFALYDADDRLVMCNDVFRNAHTHCLDVLQPGSLFEDMVRENAINDHNTNAAGRIEEYIQERLERHRNPKGPIIRNSIDGTVRIVSEAKMPDGGTTITQTDITEIAKAEEEVARQKSLFEAAINNAPYALLMTNMNREVMLFNPAFATMFGYEADEIIGKSTEIFYQNRKEFEDRGHLRNLLSPGSQDPQTVTYKRKNGEFFPAESALAPIGDSKEQVFGFIVVIRDISDQIRHAEETQQYQEIIADSRRLSLMGEMAAGLAHEINQPLAAIVNYTEGCIQRLDSNDAKPDQIRDVLKIVSEQADRAGLIINRIRGFVRKEEIKKESLCVKDTIEEALSLIKTDLERRGINLALKIEDADQHVTADKIQIQQVVLNLIRNAGDAMEEHGASKRNLTLRSKTVDDGTVEISVSDTGPGIPADKIDQIFNPFFTTKSSGLGLGLNICQSIIENHGGLMWASSQKGKGATIHFTLPMAAKPKKRNKHAVKKHAAA